MSFWCESFIRHRQFGIRALLNILKIDSDSPGYGGGGKGLWSNETDSMRLQICFRIEIPLNPKHQQTMCGQCVVGAYTNRSSRSVPSHPVRPPLLLKHTENIYKLHLYLYLRWSYIKTYRLQTPSAYWMSIRWPQRTLRHLSNCKQM